MGVSNVRMKIEIIIVILTWTRWFLSWLFCNLKCLMSTCDLRLTGIVLEVGKTTLHPHIHLKEQRETKQIRIWLHFGLHLVMTFHILIYSSFFHGPCFFYITVILEYKLFCILLILLKYTVIVSIAIIFNSNKKPIVHCNN